MDTGSLYSPTLVVFVEHVVAGAFDELLAEGITEEGVYVGFVVSVF